MTMLRQPTSLKASPDDEQRLTVKDNNPPDPIELEQLRTLDSPASATILKAGPEPDVEVLGDSVGKDTETKNSWWSNRTHRIIIYAAAILVAATVATVCVMLAGRHRGA